jgi:hypothetical protein
MTDGILLEMQNLLARVNDAPLEHRVTDYLIDDARHCSALMGRELAIEEDEQVLLCESGAGAGLSVYIDAAVIGRLRHNDPLQHLSSINIDDFCTALEGISHFQYLAWCIERARQVSLLELELQAEVDKYAVAACLFMQQRSGRFHAGLHHRMFSSVGFLPSLDGVARQRYSEANRGAARFCRRNDERFLNCRRPSVARWLVELRGLFRSGHHEKLRRAMA